MNWHSFWTTVIILGLLAYGLLNLRKRAMPQPPQFSPDSVAELPLEPLLGEHLLADYMDPEKTLQDDLNRIERLLQSYFTLVKTHAQHPMSTNEDIVEALLGKNPYKQKFLPKDHPAINAQGQLIDRFGSSLFFHPMGAGLFEIRSAGTDQALWTEDDLHRQPDGTFQRGSHQDGVLYP